MFLIQLSMSAGFWPAGALVAMILSLLPRSNSIGSAVVVVVLLLRAPSACSIGLLFARSAAFSCSRSFIRFCMSLVTTLGILLCRNSYVCFAMMVYTAFFSIPDLNGMSWFLA